MPRGQLDSVLRHLRRTAGGCGTRELTDGQLLERYRTSHDEEAFAALVHRYGRLVRSVCRNVLHQDQDADDAFQVTFLVFASKAASIRKATAVASWLHGVAYRTAMNAKRARTRRGEDPRACAGRAGDQPVTAAALREVQAIVDDEVNRLPEKYRAPFVLCCLEGKSRAEAARELGWKEGTVSSRVAQARKVLQQRLPRRGVVLAVALCAAELSRTAVTAAVPPSLVSGTIEAALAFAAGKAVAANLTSAAVAGLAKGVLKGMLTTKFPVSTALLLTVGLLTGAGAIAHRVLAAPPPDATGVAEPGPAPGAASSPGPNAGNRARADRHGDPLPPEAVVRVGTIRFRHGAPVLSLEFTPDGKTLLSGGTDGVRAWDGVTGRPLRHVAGEANGEVWSAAHSSDGKWVATFGPDRTTGAVDRPAHVWEARTGKKAGTFGKGMYQPVLLSPDGKVLATIALGTNLDPAPAVELWDVASGDKLRSWKTPPESIRGATFTRDGKTLVTGCEGKVIRFWDVATGQQVQEITGIPSIAYSFAVSPDRTLLATLAHVAPPAEAPRGVRPENRLQIWDVAEGKELRQRALPAKRLWTGFRALAFSADGTMLALPGVDELLLWDPRTGKEVRRIPFADAEPLALAFSPDGKTLAASLHGNTIHLFDVGTGKEIPRAEGPRGRVRAAALTPDGRTLATLSGGETVVLWDPATGRERQRLEGHKEGRMHLANDGLTLFSTGADKTLHVWDLAAGKELRRLSGDLFKMFILAVSPDGKALVLGAGGKSVVLADAATGRERQRFEAGSRVFWAAFTPDGRTLIVWGDDHNAHVCEVAGGKEVRKIPCQEGALAAEKLPIYVPALSPDGKWIAFGGRNRFIALRELATGKEVRRIETGAENAFDGVALLAFSPDGRTLAWAAERDPAVHLVELASGRERHRFQGHSGPVKTLTFSADGNALVSGSEDTTALVWDLTGKCGTQRGSVKPDDGEACWGGLADDDPARAYQAMRRLGASPAEAVATVRRRLQPIPAADEKRLARLLADLDSSEFAVRESAREELERLGEVAAPACRKALRGEPSAEVRRRLKALLEKEERETQDPSPERLRALRAVEVLERAGTPEAQQALRLLAAGAPGARLTQEAKASLERLARR